MVKNLTADQKLLLAKEGNSSSTSQVEQNVILILDYIVNNE